MNDTEILLKALGQLPDLVDAAKTYKETNDKTVSTLSTAIKERPKAIIPESEMSRLKCNILQTPCALPDTDGVAAQIVEYVRECMPAIVREEVKKALGETKVTMVHKHEHYSLGNLWSIVNDVTKRWIAGLAITVAILLVALACCVDYALTSELFLGKSYREICNSEYITEAEREELIKDIFAVSAYPRKYKGRPKALREKIQQNKAILRERKSRATYEHSKFSTNPRVEF
jgi:hypothetical protein